MIFLAPYYQYERGIITHLERLSSAEMGCSPFVSKDDDALMAMIHRLAKTHEISGLFCGHYPLGYLRPCRPPTTNFHRAPLDAVRRARIFSTLFI